MTSRIRQVQSLRAVRNWACLGGESSVLHTELPGATPGLSTAARRGYCEGRSLAMKLLHRHLSMAQPG